MKNCITIGVVALLASTQFAQSQECLMCDTELSLTVEQQICLGIHIDQYIAEARSTGAVLIDLDTCANEGVVTERLPTRGDPVVPIVPSNSSETSNLTSESKVAFMSEPQLICVGNLLIEEPTVPMTVDLTTCG